MSAVSPGIPADNPDKPQRASESGLGLRNPWRFSFTQTGDLFIRMSAERHRVNFQVR
jgi:hypothetical protein